VRDVFLIVSGASVSLGLADSGNRPDPHPPQAAPSFFRRSNFVLGRAGLLPDPPGPPLY
jgi:hypothetical protein